MKLVLKIPRDYIVTLELAEARVAPDRTGLVFNAGQDDQIELIGSRTEMCSLYRLIGEYIGAGGLRPVKYAASAREKSRPKNWQAFRTVCQCSESPQKPSSSFPPVPPRRSLPCPTPCTPRSSVSSA